MGGTYTLVIELSESTTIEVGALGEHRFPAGWYAYTGSAFGPGGLSRVDRHRELARGERDVHHWHVDYLLDHDATRVDRAVRTTEREIECAVARALPDAGITGFGASDCGCSSHLAYTDDRRTLLAAVERAHR
ncbi:GIY-YIG nuclease family protein [Halalkalicoccus ordinarius]|uniref:GIY-YIG nuclease family protein n=1 Tax=Halalkalicoccus ordinarius TaxID=3116651 RepID=UPI00300ED044